MRIASLLRRAAGTLALALSSSCGNDRPPTNGLLITIDTTRQDAPSLYGVTQGVSPVLDALAREALTYDNARTTVPLTLPAHASILTGLYPPRHTLRVNGKRPLPSSARTLAEAAREAGAQTAAFIAAVVLAPEFGLDQGFDLYDVPSRGNLQTSFYDERDASEVVDQSLAWLSGRDPERPFLLWVHLFDPHEPYEPPSELRQGDDRAQLYLGEVSHADRQIGRLLAHLRSEGTLDETFVVVTSDHGEGLGAHGEATHGDYCHDSTLRVPLLMRYPDGHRAGERSREVVSVVDIAPTMAEAMGLALARDLDGESLFRRSIAESRGVYFESYGAWAGYGWSPLSGWVDESGKYLHSTRPRFFDVAVDPGELENLIDSTDVSAQRAAIAALADRPALAIGDASGIDDDLRARIQALGYAGVDSDERPAPHPLENTGLPDPVDHRDLHGQMMQAYAYLNAGYYDQSSAAFQAVLARDPDNPFVLDHLGTSLIREKRFAEAVPVLQRLIGQGRHKAGVFFNLGVSLERLRRNAEAIEAFRRAAELAPDEPRIRKHLEELGGA